MRSNFDKRRYIHLKNEYKTMANRVVITGMGIYSCIGKNLEEVKESLYQGKSGIGIEEIRKEIGFRSPLTGILEIPQLKGKLDRRLRTGLAEEGEFAYISTLEALSLIHISEPTRLG